MKIKSRLILLFSILFSLCSIVSAKDYIKLKSPSECRSKLFTVKTDTDYYFEIEVKSCKPKKDFSGNLQGVIFPELYEGFVFELAPDLQSSYYAQYVFTGKDKIKIRFRYRYNLKTKAKAVIEDVITSPHETWKEDKKKAQEAQKNKDDEERRTNKANGLGNYTNDELKRFNEQRSSNQKKGYGYITDSELNQERQNNKKAGLGSISNEEVKSQKKKNEDAGLGSYTDEEIENRKKEASAKIGKNFESQNRFVSALGHYYDTKDWVNFDRVKKLVSKEIIPGTKYDNFDVYDVWQDIRNDYNKYWKHHLPIIFLPMGFYDREANYEDMTVSYKMGFVNRFGEAYHIPMCAKDEEKFTEIQKIIEEGFENSKREDWNFEIEKPYIRGEIYFYVANLEGKKISPTFKLNIQRTAGGAYSEPYSIVASYKEEFNTYTFSRENYKYIEDNKYVFVPVKFVLEDNLVFDATDVKFDKYEF